jgi:hypothetical protein
MKYRDLGAWFQNPSAQCSSHHGADSYERGVFGAYVYENNKAWTQGNANDYCLSLEMCGYAEWSRSEWLNNRPILVDNAAEWLRYMVDKYAVPWTLLNDSQAQNPNARGICEHVNLGSWGSGHWDCGDFPMDVVIDKAKKWGGGSAPEIEGVLVSSSVAIYQGKQYVAFINPDGKVCCNGGIVDPGSNAKSGVGLAIDSASGRKVITYTNAGGALCKYQQDVGDDEWHWADTGWGAK